MKKLVTKQLSNASNDRTCTFNQGQASTLLDGKNSRDVLHTEFENSLNRPIHEEINIIKAGGPAHGKNDFLSDAHT